MTGNVSGTSIYVFPDMKCPLGASIIYGWWSMQHGGESAVLIIPQQNNNTICSHWAEEWEEKEEEELEREGLSMLPTKFPFNDLWIEFG